MDFSAAVQRAQGSIVCLYLNDRGDHEDAWATASGVLARIGSRTFVLTAGHNLAGLQPRDVFLMFPRQKIVLPWSGGRCITRLFANEEPDVGVIELNEADRGYWGHMVALHETDFGGEAGAEAGEVMLLLGFPSARTHVEKMKEAEDPRSPHFFASAGFAVRARLDEGVRSPFEPPGGRGFHVVYHGATFFDPDTGRPAPLPPPNGLSGGPLVVVSETKVRLLGLARSKHGEDEQFEWCEPASEAVRLLLEHDDPVVRSAAGRILQSFE